MEPSQATVACIAQSMASAIADWREHLLEDQEVIELIRQSDDERMQEAEAKFHPVEEAVRHLVQSLEKASVPPLLVQEVEDMVSTITALSIRAAASDPSTMASAMYGTDDPGSHSSNGLSIGSTALGRRASASYRVFDRMGGWELLSACVDGVYNRVLKDPRIGNVEPEAEGTLKTALLEFLSAAFSGIHGKVASSSMWKKHQEIVFSLGLLPSYFDCLIEHFQATLDELGVPQEDSETAITALKTNRPQLDDFGDAHDRASVPARLSLFGRQSMRQSLSLGHHPSPDSSHAAQAACAAVSHAADADGAAGTAAGATKG